MIERKKWNINSAFFVKFILPCKYAMKGYPKGSQMHGHNAQREPVNKYVVHLVVRSERSDLHSKTYCCAKSFSTQGLLRKQ